MEALAVRLRLLVLFVLAGLSAGRASAAPPVGGAVPAAPTAEASEPRWYDFTFRGRKVGYAKAWEVETIVEGRPAIEFHEESRTELNRMTETIVIESNIVAWARPDGEPLGFVHERTEGSQARKIVGRREGDAFVILHIIGGRPSEERIPLTEAVVLSTSIEPLFYPRLSAGASREGQAISESEGDLQPYAYRVAGVQGAGAARRFVVERSQGGIESRALVRPDGIVERSVVPAMGASFVLVGSEAAAQLEVAVDIFDEALFSASARIPDRGTLERLELRLETKNGKPPPLPTDRRQTVSVEDGATRLVLDALEPPPSSPRLPVTSSELAEQLSPTPYESLDDPALVEASKNAVGDATHVWLATQRLVRFVYSHITDKTLAQAFTSASEALASREGDCTEHAVLFSALAKIAGIPTRLVTGLVYIGGEKNQFGYHEWVEVWTGDAWHPVDPTFGQATADPTHIKFTTGQSDPAGLRRSGIVAGSLIGNLDMKVLAYTLRSGETVRLP